MHYRTFDGVRLSEVGVGCYALSGVYGKKDLSEFKCMLQRAYELGVNFFDTSDTYGDGERVLGEVVRPFRDQVVLATKVGMKDGFEPDLSKEYLKLACEKSLRRLGTDRIDLYQIHYADPKAPITEIIETLEELKTAGKIQRYGISHLSLENAKIFFETKYIFSSLMAFSPVSREPRQTLLPLCKKYAVGAIAFGVTGRGILSGKLTQRPAFDEGDIRHFDPLFQRERYQSGLRLAEKLAEIGALYGKSSVQVAINWVLLHPEIICALSGPSTVAHLEENIGGCGWELTRADRLELETIFQQEDDWQAEQQKVSLTNILTNPIMADPFEAYKDLVYIFETSLMLGLVSDADIFPIYLELLGLRNKLSGAETAMKQIHAQLQELIPLD